MLTVLAFIVALGLLIAIHEYGHYRVAVACGVKVLRFSIGFGKTIYRWQPVKPRPGQTTEFVIGALPLGGFVKMLDEREGPVDASERHRAFNTQSLKARFAIVAAGPLANLLLAILLYATVNWMGVQEPRAILASPVAGSIAEASGLKGGEWVAASAGADQSFSPVRSFDDLRWRMTQSALNGEDIRLQVAAKAPNIDKDAEKDVLDASGMALREVTLTLSRLESKEADAALFKKIGILGPWTQAVLGDILPGGAADKAGLKAGDVVQAFGTTQIVDGQQLRLLIREATQNPATLTQTWQVQRQGALLQLLVTPEAKDDNGVAVGRIGAYVGLPPDLITVRHGPLDGLWLGAVRTWEVSILTLRMMGKMVIGQASLKNLSGPLSIADYAGKSASLGLTSYLVFLALVSVSLGVLNLLPVPVLDGGHLMYYLWEAVTGKSVSDRWMERFQRVGAALLMTMMAIALFNDLSRYFG